MSTIKAPPIYKIIASQLIAVGFITTVGYTTLGWISAYSLLLGGMICTVPNAYFSFKAFRYRGARAAQKIVRAFYLGEAVKILLMGAGFALSFIYVEPLSSRALFAGFITVYLVGLMATMRVTRKTNY
ncbi:MAG: ATP synthase subunit I [Pseudomonadales bacterium]|nr:ATP synthase subunit I [Pseudomonadales bacterium]MCP5330170.1 ATP synthase subunit I [Pseudomonadales bacterium]MCP5344447.1 ATP synthase subunit I [Pseudomonadales bacterium]